MHAIFIMISSYVVGRLMKNIDDTPNAKYADHYIEPRMEWFSYMERMKQKEEENGMYILHVTVFLYP